MKRMKTLIGKHLPAALAGIAMLLCGCGQDTGMPDKPGSVPLGVGSLRLEAMPVTRAGGTPVTTDGAAIRVFLTGSGGYRPVSDKTYTCTSGTWSSADPIYVDSRTGKAVGVYDPHGLVSFGNSTVTTNVLQAQAYAENKLWYYDNTSGAAVNNVSSPVAFSMKCAYARLKFTISRNASYPAVCKVSRIVISPSSGDFYTAAQVDIADGSITGTPAATYIIDTSSLPMNTTGIAAGTADTSVDRLFPAQKLEASAGLTFRLSVDGAEYLVTVPAATFNEIKAGVQYTVGLEMSAQGMAGIRVTGVTTEDWGPGADIGPLVPLP